MRTIQIVEKVVLVGGDVIVLIASLWLTLLARHLALPSSDLFFTHLVPFLFLFVVWVVVFFVGGLYDTYTVSLKQRIPQRIFVFQSLNIIVAAVFFFITPLFDIAPKTVLVLYLFISSVLLAVWRVGVFPHLLTRRKRKALIIGSGADIDELVTEINNNPKYHFRIVEVMPAVRDPAAVGRRISALSITVIVADTRHHSFEPLLPVLYNMYFSEQSIQLIDIRHLYEDIFGRLPLSFIRYDWFLENIETTPRVVYDSIKRMIDIVGAIVVGAFSLPFYPIVYVLIKAEDNGPLFVRQERVGQNNRIIHLTKFRSMTGNDMGRYGPDGKSELVVTRVGRWLRFLRIDELPQVWSVLRGDQSLIGPRPELPAIAASYDAEIPYYNARHLIKPGLSGWAQIYHEQHPHHGNDVEETRRKLAYDLYYVKNRSLLLDISIAFKTFRILISRTGI